MRKKTLWMVLGMMVAVASVACEPEESGGSGAAAGSGGSGDGGGTGSECDLPAGAEVVMPWKKLEPVDPTGSPGPAYGLANDGTSVYVNFFDVLVKMPLAGGEVTTVYKSTKELTTGFRTFASTTGIYVFETGRETVLLPYDGSAPKPVTLPFPGNFSVVQFDPASDTFWAEVRDFEARTITLFKAKAGAASAETVLGPLDSLYDESPRWFAAEDRVFVQAFKPPYPIYTAQPGGALASFPVDPPSAGIIGLLGSHLFYSSKDISRLGVYRIPVAGGTAQRVYSSYTTAGTFGGGRWKTPGAIYLNDATNLLKIPENGEGKLLSSVPTGACTTHEVMAHGGYVYTVTFRSSTGENTVWRIKE
ncbi:MAG: hypothetical protein RMJ98_00655 [Myxococcales bacterium]|nr:hypothetical protein [Polyangiaceae bacterium]MDW8247795.1 hypothetical protein [Myxococcales bacterium]